MNSPPEFVLTFAFCLFTSAFLLHGRRALLRCAAHVRHALTRETFARRLLGAGRAQVRIEVEAEQLLDLRRDGRQHDVREPRKLRDDVPAFARRLLTAARVLVLLVEGARDAEADEDAD